jgi:protease I
MAVVILPLPDDGFDPTETGVPWSILRQRGHNVVFATPTGKVGHADRRKKRKASRVNENFLV